MFNHSLADGILTWLDAEHATRDELLEIAECCDLAAHLSDFDDTLDRLLKVQSIRLSGVYYQLPPAIKASDPAQLPSFLPGDFVPDFVAAATRGDTFCMELCRGHQEYLVTHGDRTCHKLSGQPENAQSL